MKEPVLVTPYRNKLEKKLGDQLDLAGLPFRFEKEKLTYSVPQRLATYLPDFVLLKLDGTKMYIEAKGNFGGTFGTGGKFTSTSAQVRQKMIFVRDQNPGVDIRFIFSRAASPIYTGSPTTHGKWATDHGFLWSDKGIFPLDWIKEIKHG